MKNRNFESDIKDGVIFVLLSMKLSGKRVIYNDPANQLQKRKENFEKAFDLLKEKGYTVDELRFEDFEKDESKTISRIYSSIWKVMLQFQKNHMIDLKVEEFGKNQHQIFKEKMKLMSSILDKRSELQERSEKLSLLIEKILPKEDDKGKEETGIEDHVEKEVSQDLYEELIEKGTQMIIMNEEQVLKNTSAMIYFKLLVGLLPIFLLTFLLLFRDNIFDFLSSFD